MFYMVKYELPGLSGGVSNIIWDEYVYCILHALVVWEAYCTRAQILTRPEIGEDDIIPVL